MRVSHVSIVWQYVPAETLLVPSASIRLVGPAFQSDFASFIFFKAENLLNMLASVLTFVNVMGELVLMNLFKT